MFKSLIETTVNEDYRKATFIIPKGYSIPDIIQQLTGDEFAAYLTIIAAVHCEVCGRAEALEKDNEEIIKQRITLSIAKEEVRLQQEATRRYEEAWSVWQEERGRLGAQIQRLQLQQERVEQQLEDDKRRMREVIEGEYKGIIADLRGVVAKSADEYAVKLAGAKTSADEMVQFYKDQLMASNKRAAALEERLIDKTAVMKSSVRRGRHAEEEFAAQAASTCGWNCERTADTSHCGDYTATIDGLQVMFEIKNYTNIVPAKEVQKFRRDMDEHREIHVGIFITMETEISGMRGDSGCIFKTEWSVGGQLLVFMTQFAADTAGNFIILDKVLRVVAEILLKDKDVEDAGVRLQRGLKYLETSQDRLRGIINRMMIDKRTAEENYSQSLMSLKLLREEIIMIFEMLSGASLTPEPRIKQKRKKKGAENLN